MKKFTDITVLLDRSGSMVSIKEPMQTAFNKFIEEHQAVPTTKVTLVQFDTANIQEVVYQGVPVGAVEKLILNPRGGTPLVDALATLIDNTGSRYANMPESERPDQVLFIIITDGQENASNMFTRAQVFEKVTTQTTKYNWQFVYLGANQDAIAEAQSYGIAGAQAMRFLNSVGGSSASLGATMSNTVNYTKNVNRGETRSLAYTAEQRKEAADGDEDILKTVRSIKKGKI